MYTPEDIFFQSNPYDVFITKKMIERENFVVIWHFGDLKISYVSAEVVSYKISYLKGKYRELQISRGGNIIIWGCT